MEQIITYKKEYINPIKFNIGSFMKTMNIQSIPLISICPVCMDCKVLIQRSKVVLPEPLGPINPTIAPSFISKETLFNANVF